MPRAELSPATKIVEFFEKSSLDIASLVLGLATDKVRERRTRSTEAKKRATTVTARTATPAQLKKRTNSGTHKTASQSASA